MLEFILMLLIEKKVNEDEKFYYHFLEVADKKTFNDRYKQLLDEFLSNYALNNTEKSEINL